MKLRRRMSRKLALGLAVAGCTLLGGAAVAQEVIRVGWTIPAEEAKYWLMRRIGAVRQRSARPTRSSSCSSRAPRPWFRPWWRARSTARRRRRLSLANGAIQGGLQAYIIAQHVGERPGSFSVYWAVKDD